MNDPIGEVCAVCGKEIGMLDSSFYSKGLNDDIGQTFHVSCGMSLTIKQAVAAERERCAKIASDYADAHCFSTLLSMAGSEIAASIRAEKTGGGE